MNRQQYAEKIMVAVDYSSAEAAEPLLKKIEGIPCWLKIGMELYYTAGPSFVSTLKDRGYRIFLDLKFHDIPNTVKGAARSLTRLGVDMFNVHAAGGRKMMESALEGIQQEATPDHNPILIAVTQLTSTNQQMLNNDLGISGRLEDVVQKYALMTQDAGLAGVVASPLEVADIKKVCGEDFITVTPGIRPQWSEKGDQSRVATPKDAIQIGSDFLVIGRPITTALDPREAIEKIIEEMSEV